MMDCKKVLKENEGDLEKFIEWFWQKGIVFVDKKFGCIVVEGLVYSYIYFGGCIGVLVEVNCEIDFVVWGDCFKDLVNDVVMQIVVCFNVEYVSVVDIFQEMVVKEKEIEMGCDDLGKKFVNIKEKIV